MIEREKLFEWSEHYTNKQIINYSARGVLNQFPFIHNDYLSSVYLCLLRTVIILYCFVYCEISLFSVKRVKNGKQLKFFFNVSKTTAVRVPWVLEVNKIFKNRHISNLTFVAFFTCYLQAFILLWVNERIIWYKLLEYKPSL